MLRVTGLPSVARYPEAVVARGSDLITIRFGGSYYGEQTMEVPLGYANVEDDETAELELLAQLQRTGYLVERIPPTG